MFYRIKNSNLYDYADFKYSEECQETDIITQTQLDKDRRQVIVAEVEVEIEVPDFEIVEEEVVNPETGEVEIIEVQKPIMIEYEDTVVVIDYDEEGNPTGSHEETVIKQKQQTHIETVMQEQLILNPDYVNIELEKVKAEKIRENDTVRDLAINSGVTYDDILFDSDTDQKVNLLAMVSAMGDEDTIVWYGMNNDSLECTKADLIAIGGLITQLHAFCWAHNAELKALIEAATTVEEVNAIVIDYGLEPVDEESEVEEEEPEVEEPQEEPQEEPEEEPSEEPEEEPEVEEPQEEPEEE